MTASPSTIMAAAASPMRCLLGGSSVSWRTGAMLSRVTWLMTTAPPWVRFKKPPALQLGQVTADRRDRDAELPPSATGRRRRARSANAPGDAPAARARRPDGSIGDGFASGPHRHPPHDCFRSIMIRIALESQRSLEMAESVDERVSAGEDRNAGFGEAKPREPTCHPPASASAIRSANDGCARRGPSGCTHRRGCVLAEAKSAGSPLPQIHEKRAHSFPLEFDEQVAATLKSPHPEEPRTLRSEASRRTLQEAPEPPSRDVGRREPSRVASIILRDGRSAASSGWPSPRKAFTHPARQPGLHDFGPRDVLRAGRTTPMPGPRAPPGAMRAGAPTSLNWRGWRAGMPAIARSGQDEGRVAESQGSLPARAAARSVGPWLPTPGRQRLGQGQLGGATTFKAGRARRGPSGGRRGRSRCR